MFISDNTIEKFIFDKKAIWLLFFTMATFFFANQASQLKPSPSIEKLLPMEHQYLKNWTKHRNDMPVSNKIRVAVAINKGDIFTEEYMSILKKISDDLFIFPGVDKGKMQSLWTPNTRWHQVTAEGFDGGPIVSSSYDGSEFELEKLRKNILRSMHIGSLVADNYQSTIINVPLLEINPLTGERLDYREFCNRLETEIRDKYSSDEIHIHIDGMAKVFGDLIDGLVEVAAFFLLAIGTTFLLLFLDTGCYKSSLIVVLCSITAVIWQLGILRLLGFGIDPYAMLVPFLVFAIGVSHGVQIINEIAVEHAQGVPMHDASVNTLNVLAKPGITALISDAVGFLTLLFIPIAVIRELAINASIGVAVIILTNLVLLPILMSMSSICETNLCRIREKKNKPSPLWKNLAGLAEKGLAPLSIILALEILVIALYVSQDLKIGDLDRGEPLLRADSRYNLDANFMTDNYSTSPDVFVVFAESEPNAITQYEKLMDIDNFMWHMKHIDEVQSIISQTTIIKGYITAMNEANPKWSQIPRDKQVINTTAGSSSVLRNRDNSMAPIILFLKDHKADTLEKVVRAAEEYQATSDAGVNYVLATGPSGFEAAKNQTIKYNQYRMMFFVFAVVSGLVFVTFRSWRPVVCIICPLIVSSILCEALMTLLDIGIKVETLPVIALGVGIGVDYGIYIYSRLNEYLHRGMSLEEAYYHTIRITGKAVIFTGFALASGVVMWVFSDIKFQADLGLLLTFMFLINMINAIWLIPAFARYFIKLDFQNIKAHTDSQGPDSQGLFDAG